MRARLVCLLLCASVLAGCDGLITLREDDDAAARFRAQLNRQGPGARTTLGALLPRGGWTRMWAFPGPTTTQAIEDRIGVPFPEAPEGLPDDITYLVFSTGQEVVSAFTFTGPSDVRPACLLRQLADGLPPSTPVVLREDAGEPLGTASLTTVAGAATCR